MKHILLIFLSLSLFLAPLEAQAKWRVPLKKVTVRITNKSTRVKGLSSWQVSRVLERRVKSSFESAKKIQQKLPAMARTAFGEPVRRVRRAKDMPQARVYADKPFLTTREQTANYMAAQSNRLFVQQSENLLRWHEQVEQHLPQMEEAVRQMSQPEHPIAWLAEQIPAQTTTLFVGEMHGFTEIRQGVADLLSTLRAQNPAREIILFTEFLPENFHWRETTDPALLDLPKYATIWEEANHNHIEVIGLEPEVALADSCEVEGLRETGKKAVFPQWAHLEGMRLRNEAWLQTMQTYRAQHPDALFVVYSGSAHSSYYFPFSLPTLMSKEHPFVVTLYPDKVLTATSSFWVSHIDFVPYQEPLERLTKHVLFQRPVLQFKDPEISRLAGFDVRIKLSIDEERHAAENGL